MLDRQVLLIRKSKFSYCELFLCVRNNIKISLCLIKNYVITTCGELEIYLDIFLTSALNLGLHNAVDFSRRTEPAAQMHSKLSVSQDRPEPNAEDNNPAYARNLKFSQ